MLIGEKRHIGGRYGLGRKLPPHFGQEIGLWYFTALEKIKSGEQDEVFQFAESAGLEELYIKKYLDTLKVGVETVDGELFEKTHGFYIAVAQGFFRKYFYTRGSSFTFLNRCRPYLFKICRGY